MSIRAEKVASLVRRILAEPINELAREFSAGLVTVTSVRMSPDLQVAKIYLSIYGGKILPLKFISLLEEKAGYLRKNVGANLRLRATPELRFFLDDTLDEMDRIQKLLDSVK